MDGVSMFAYSIFDDKSCSYGIPYFASTDGLAIRSFADLMNDSQSVIFRHPQDFRLYKVGTFDLRSGTIQPVDVPLYVFSSADVDLSQSTL